MLRRLMPRTALFGLAALTCVLLAPKLTAVFTEWPRLGGFNPGWFVLMLVLQAGSFASVWLLMRITVPGLSWRVAAYSHLSANSVSRLVPGGGAVGSAVQFRMLTRAGLDGATAGSALTVVSLMTTALLFAMPLLTIPAILLGQVPSGLTTAALYTVPLFVLVLASGVLLARTDWPLRRVGRTVDWLMARFGREVPGGLAAVLVLRRNEMRAALGQRWRTAALAAAGRSFLDCLTLMVALIAAGQGAHPVLVLLAFVVVSLLSTIPITPGGLGFVEAGLVGMLVVAGIPAGPAALATLAYRLVAYWLPVPIGLPAWLALRRDRREPAVAVSSAA